MCFIIYYKLYIQVLVVLLFTFILSHQRGGGREGGGREGGGTIKIITISM